jgi:hypothetical protein
LHKLKGLVLLVALFADTLPAQEGSGRLAGSVTDTTKAAIPEVEVLIMNRGTGLTRSVKTDAAGDYAFPSLPIGVYDVNASREGFATLRSTGVTVTVGSTTRLDLELSVAAVGQQVEVQATASVLNTDSAEGGVFLGSTQVTNLPLNGRNFLQLVTLQPGVLENSGAGRISFTFNGAPPEQGINLLVDGTDATGIESSEVGGINRAPGQSTFALGLDSIAEFVVHSNNFSVRYGRALGGVIEVVTKSGSNELHGNVFHFFRNNVLNANTIQGNAAGLSTPPLRFNQFGGNAGGRIVKNKVFFWGGYEGVRRRSGSTNTFSVLSDEGRAKVVDPAIAAFVRDFIPRANQPPTTNPNVALLVRNNVSPVREDIATGRIDWQASPNDTIFARYNIHDTNGSTPGLGTPDNDTIAGARQQLVTISATHVFSPSTTLNLRAGVNRLVNLSGTSGPGVTLNLAGIFSVGAGYLNQWATSYTYAGDFTKILGRHTLSAGFEYRTTVVNRSQGGPTELAIGPCCGTYSFLAGPNQFDNFFRNIPDQFASPGVIGGNSGRSGNLSGYVEDSFKVFRTLTLNIGLRYDYFFRPTEKYGRIIGIVGSPFPISNIRFTNPGDQVIPRDWDGFGPRFGLAWTPLQRLVIRAGYGIFVGQNYPALTTAAAFTFVPPVVPKELFDPNYAQSGIVFTRQDRPDLIYPDVSFVTKEALLAKMPPPSPNFPMPDWKNSYTHQWSMRVEGDIASETRLSVGYVGTRSVHVIGEGRHNLPRPLLGNTRENPLFSTIILRGTFNNANFNSLQVSLNRRLSRGLLANVTYAWAHSIDDIFGFADLNNPGVIPQNNSLRLQRGNSAFDIRHSLTVDYNYQFPTPANLPRVIFAGWAVGGITRIRSSMPYTVTTGTNVGDGVSTQRPNLTCADATTGATPDLFARVLNPACFVTPTNRDPESGLFIGNLGRNTFYGPWLVNFDINLNKNTKITERLTYQIRADFFNSLNNTNFMSPVSTLNNPNFGRILGAGPGRAIQFAMKLIF